MQHRVTQAAVKAVIDMQKCREQLGAILTCLVRIKFGDDSSIWSSNCKADTGKEKYDEGWHYEIIHRRKLNIIE